MKTTLTIVFSTLCFAIGTWCWFGGFTKVTPSIQNAKESIFIVSNHLGNDVFLIDTNSNIHVQLEGKGALPTELIMYKNGSKTECCHLQGLLINAEHLSELNNFGYNKPTIKLSEGIRINASFPYKGKFSRSFAIMRVYPALRLFCIQNGISPEQPILEIVNVAEKKIEICMILDGKYQNQTKSLRM